jgi:hypothetical protein
MSKAKDWMCSVKIHIFKFYTSKAMSLGSGDFYEVGWA